MTNNHTALWCSFTLRLLTFRYSTGLVTLNLSMVEMMMAGVVREEEQEEEKAVDDKAAEPPVEATNRQMLPAENKVQLMIYITYYRTTISISNLTQILGLGKTLNIIVIISPCSFHYHHSCSFSDKAVKWLLCVDSFLTSVGLLYLVNIAVLPFCIEQMKKYWYIHTKFGKIRYTFFAISPRRTGYLQYTHVKRCVLYSKSQPLDSYI